MRVQNVNIPDNKRSIISLTYIKGIGKSKAREILKKAGVDESKRIKHLDEIEKTKINKAIRDAIETEGLLIEGALITKTKLDIKRLQVIKSYRGGRHRKGLPVRGQSTRQNARTWKGPKKTVANKKKAPK